MTYIWSKKDNTIWNFCFEIFVTPETHVFKFESRISEIPFLREGCLCTRPVRASTFRYSPLGRAAGPHTNSQFFSSLASPHFSHLGTHQISCIECTTPAIASPSSKKQFWRVMGLAARVWLQLSHVYLGFRCYCAENLEGLLCFCWKVSTEWDACQGWWLFVEVSWGDQSSCT